MKENRHLLIGIVIGALSAGALVFFPLNKNFKTQIQAQQLQIAQQAELIDSIRHNGMTILLCNVLDKVDMELANNPKRILSDETIARIGALSYSLVSHMPIKSDSVSERILSPERGELLLMLCKMKIDSVSLKKIMLQTSFEGAVLRDADLKDADLRLVDLKKADLKDVNLEGANLIEAELRSAKLWGANLTGAHLNKANLTTADMRWSVLNGADLKTADLHGADMSSAQLRKTDFTGADLQWAEFSGAILHETNLTGTNLASTNFTKAQLENSILKDANLTSSHLNEANLTGANLTGANMSGTNMAGANISQTELSGVIVIDKNWLTRLDEWQVKGAKEIQSRYKLIDESSKNKSQYRLEKN
ncbi:MAG: pentapeptide repeat-containing protein [Saprospiraceae bacterium]